MRPASHSFLSARWWSALWRRSQSSRPRRARSVRPRLERLEDRLTPSGPTFSTVASFSGGNGGSGPEAGLLLNNGVLYGTTSTGGTSSDGTVFSESNGIITTLASFDSTDGSDPVSNLVLYNGNLYGTTETGGANSDGTLFEVSDTGGTITVLHDFGSSSSDGTFPVAGLVMDGSGNMFGTTETGGAFADGSIFEYSSSNGYSQLASFSARNNGGYSPDDTMILDGNGDLFGTTSSGGVYSNGTVFELAKNSSTPTMLASFNNNASTPTGMVPMGSLVRDSSGNLYGTASAGGANNDGTIFEESGGTITALAAFAGNSNGAKPEGGLYMDGSGNLYGTTFIGGNNSAGTVFELSQGQSTISNLYSFAAGNDGGNPQSNLIADSSGNLYGTAKNNGGSSAGTIFEMVFPSATTDTWTGANHAVDTNWSDGANWSNGTAPTTGQTAIFTNNSSVKSFTSTVDSGFTNSIAGLDIDSTWGGTITVNSALSIKGNLTLASGTYGGGAATTVTGKTNQWTGGSIELGSGGFTNTGTLTVNTSGGNLVMTGNGTFTNKGTFDEAGTNTLDLENSAVLTNASGATFNLTNDGSVSQSSGGTLNNAGTLEKTAGTGTSTISSSFVNSNAITVKTGTLSLATAGGTSTGGTFNVSTGATLDLTGGNTVAYEGTYTGTGTGTVALKSGTLQVGSTGATFNMASKLFQWTGGTLDVTNGSFTNTGTINYAGTASVTLNGGNSLINKKTINQTSTGTLALTNGATLNNYKGSTYNIESNGGIGLSSGGTLINAGNLEKTKGTGTTTIATNSLSNTGTVQVTTGTLDISASVTQLPSTTLTAGTWKATGSSTVSSTLDLTAASGITIIGSAAHVTVSGLKATFTNLGSGLNTIDKGGSLTLLNSQSLSTTGSLTNNGSLTLGSACNLTVNGTLKSTGSLTATAGSGTATVTTTTFSNTGSVTVSNGTLNISGTVTQVSNGKLTAGKWIVNGGAHTTSTLDLTSAGTLSELSSPVSVTLNGLNTTFTNLSGLATIDQGATFSLLGGQAFTTAGALTDNGSLTIGPNSILTVSGGFTQGSTATLTIQMGGTNSSPTIGQLVSTTGSMTLAGNLKVTTTVVPGLNSSFELLDNEGNSAISGTFVQGTTLTVTKGSTKMTFSINYTGNDGDGTNNVYITRTA